MPRLRLPYSDVQASAEVWESLGWDEDCNLKPSDRCSVSLSGIRRFEEDALNRENSLTCLLFCK